MTLNNKSSILLTVACIMASCVPSSRTLAVDVESFEFNDANGTQLASAANTANPGNAWEVSSGMAPSQVQMSLGGRPSSYYIIKESSALESNYLDIANITSGTYYLTTQIAGWDFEETANEQFRLAFMNDDDPPDFGNTITAQMQLGRSTTDLSGNVTLTATALGPGASNVANTLALPAIMTDPFQMTLELNKTSNTYKVFYRIGSGATQVLGAGAIDPPRGGNSLRMSANNNFGDFNDQFPTDFIDYFAVDRIAVADTNPHTDLITLDIDRDNGAMTIRNTSGAAVSGIESYSITSAVGGLNPAGWMPVAGGSNTSSNDELMQSFGGGGISWTNGQEIPLSMGDGAWLKSPYEDVEMVLNLTGGATRTVNVNFIDNGGMRFMPGDFSFNNLITVADYQTLIGNAETDLTAMSIAQAYQKGDLDRDRVNSIRDFVEFKRLYLLANPGAGSFSDIFAGVPEPSTLLTAGIAALLFVARRDHRVPCKRPIANPTFEKQLRSYTGDSMLRRLSGFLACVLIVVVAILAGGQTANADILEDFAFSEPNGSTLGDAENSANPGNGWIVHANTVESEILDGNFRIRKQSVLNQAENYLEIDNITSGRAWLVAEIAGWNYTTTASSPSERMRFAFLNNDPAGGSTITAEADIDRDTMTGGLKLIGDAFGFGSVDPTGNYQLPLVQTNPFTIALELNKDANTYTVHYKDGDAPWSSLDPGNVGDVNGSMSTGTLRSGNSVRFAFTGTFGDSPEEFFDVSRIYLTDTNPVIGPVDPTTLSLSVNTTTREVFIKNETESPISFDSYRIESTSESLSFAEWESLSGRVPPLDPFEGGDDPGETWGEAFGSDDMVLAESYLLSSSAIAPDDSLYLGKAFKAGGMQDLVFQYHDVTSGAIVTVDPDYEMSVAVPGDYNGDGRVDAGDYVRWRNHLNEPNENNINNNGDGGGVTLSDYGYWKARYGDPEGAGGGGIASAVPEPTSLTFLAMGGLVAAAANARRCRRGVARARCRWANQ